MASLSRRRRRLYDPEAEREIWRHVFYLELMQRPRARREFEQRILPPFREVVLATLRDTAAMEPKARNELLGELKNDSYAQTDSWIRTSSKRWGRPEDHLRLCAYAQSMGYAVLMGMHEGLLPIESLSDFGIEAAAGRLMYQVTDFCRQILRCQQGLRAPLWLVDLLAEACLFFGTPPSTASGHTRYSDTPISDSELGVVLPGAANKPVPLRADKSREEGGRNPLQDVPVIADSLPLKLEPGQDLVEWRRDAHTRLDDRLNQMLQLAEDTFHHMNPTTEERYRRDAADLARLCVDGWKPIGQPHTKRLKRFAAFIGIDYPGQKLAMDLS